MASTYFEDTLCLLLPGHTPAKVRPNPLGSEHDLTINGSQSLPAGERNCRQMASTLTTFGAQGSSEGCFRQLHVFFCNMVVHGLHVCIPGYQESDGCWGQPQMLLPGCVLSICNM
jgi:hypothetical protein